MKRKLLALTLAAGFALGGPVATFANDCHNVSRAAPANPDQFQMQGNWAWIPEAQAWFFVVPGSPLAAEAGTPDANGNFTNGRTDHLLGMSANCDPSKTTSRQTTNGIQNDCTIPAP
jgi:hypothetical protein